MTKPMLFEPLQLRSLKVRHRGWVSPMCQYSCDADNAPGIPNDWHLVHLGSLATGGAALIVAEATAVSPVGRISPRDTGLWNDAQIEGWRRITDFVHAQDNGAKIAVQIAHAGRKASTYPPFAEEGGYVPPERGGWQTLGPTDAAFGNDAAPVAMTEEDINGVIRDFASAVARAVAAGFDALEIHGAHGYLLSSFLSPLVNTRSDSWGGSDEGRMRLPLAVIDAVGREMPDGMPLLMRISATDWHDVEGDLLGSIEFIQRAQERGVDLVDVSSGGNSCRAPIRPGPGYQTELASRIRAAVDIPVGTVGMITDGRQAELILRTGQADGVFIGRAALADPRWWQRAAHQLGYDLPWVPPYQWAQPQSTY